MISISEMAIISEYEEPTSSAASTKPFQADLDPSNPLGFLQTALEFLAKETDLFKSDALVADISSVVRSVKSKVEAAEERKRKDKAREIGNAEKKVKEEKPSVQVKQGPKEEMEKDSKISQVKEEKVESEKGIYFIRLPSIILFLFLYPLWASESRNLSLHLVNLLLLRLISRLSFQI